MNNIYKVIWSKAKNCYVVASEIARSHTKSASGSEKIGGVTRRSLLASLMALSLLCGGLGVASAADGTVNVDKSAATTGTAVVYTQEGTESYVEQALTNYDTKTQVDDKIDAKIEALTTTGDVATNKDNITTLRGKTTGLSDDGKSLTDMNSVETDALKVTRNISDGNVTTTLAEIDASMTQTVKNKEDIATLKGTTNVQQTAIDDLKQKTTEISYADGEGTKISGVTIKNGNIVGDGNSAITQLANVETGRIKTDSINGKTLAGTTVATEKEVKDVADAVKAETELREAADIALEGKINTLNENGVKYDTDVKDTITLKGPDGTKITHLKEATLSDSSTDAVTGKQLYKTNAELAAETKARTDKDTELEKRIATNSGDITALDGKIKTNADNIKANADAIAATNKRTAGIDRIDATNGTTIEGNVTVNSLGDVTAKGKLIGDGVDAGSLNVENASHLKGDVTMDNKLSVTGDTSLGKTDVGGALNVTGASDLKGNVILGTDTANTVTVNGKADFKAAVNMDKGLTVTNGDTSLKKTDVDGALNVTGESSLKNTTVGGTLDVTGATTLKGTLTAKENATFEKNVTVQNDLTVDGKLNVGEISMKNNELKNGKKHDSATTITADEISNLAKVTEQGNTTESQFTHNEKGTFNHARDGNNADWKESNSNVTADGVSNKMTDSDENRHTYYQTAAETKEQLVNGDKSNFEKKTAKGNTISITEKDADGNLKSSLTNTQTVNGEKTSVTNKDSSSTINQGADQIRYNVTSKDANNTSSSIEVKADGITNTSKDGTITNDANHIENTANTMKTTVTGKATESYGELETTVKGQATENFNRGLNTNVIGTENHTVTGKQINTVTEGQINNITGGQKNNILTGDQETTVSNGSIINKAENGNISNTAKNVTNEGTESVINKAGDMTVTTDKTTGTTFGNGTPNDTTVINGGTIGTNKVNANETNTKKLTAGADDGANGGRLTVDADGVKGSYKSGNYMSKSYILANTLKSGVDNGKDPTDTDFVGSRTDHYMDGDKAKLDETVKDADGSNVTNKTSTGTATTITDGNGNISATIQNAKNLAGSVTNGTETGVSGIHANDDGSVSIDSAVAGGSSISTINQKKDSITSQVTDGTTITKTEQGTKDITNTATAGTITNDAKDIVNKAQDTITNTAGTSITNQVKDSKVTTDVDGTTFENKTAAVSDGGTTTTKINGNHINTGRVDANELGVSDKDDQGNTADFSVEAGKGVKASAGNGTTTGSLDVKADEVSSSVKDADGKGSTFKQRIDAIMMESKNVSIKAEETLTNEAKVITNKASEVINNEAININNTATGIIKSKASEIQNQADRLISNKVGENTWENMEDGKITTSIKDGAKQNLTQSDAAGTTQSTVDGGKSTVTIQNADGLADAVTDGTNTSVQNQTASAIAAAVKDGAGNENASVANATTSANTIKSGSKVNTVISTADGTSFINSEAAAPVGDGTEVKTTIKGNTITTGKVTMDYAEVMKDLGVRGNANITGKTTTGSLEVTGTSTLKGDVTMGSNATVKKDLTVEGNTNLKNTKVDGTLDVTQKATFGDSVSIAKDLSVDGNATIKGDVTAKSYKVGDKTYINAAGINANDQKITNVADGSISEGSKDAVNGGQLYTVKNDLEGKVNKVGANAAAMANLHPMEFDPDSKWNIAAAIGNYGSETAAALGAFYRPNDDVMVNLSTAFGTGENMVGGGVSVRLGKGGNKLSREENNALKDQVNDLTARMDALLSVLNPNMSKDFPDVPENHWAYEAVSRLAGNDIVQGYPDGEFHGERTMTRYEMAEIIYNALSRGAEAEKELVEEFKPELQAMAASEKATAEKAEG